MKQKKVPWAVALVVLVVIVALAVFVILRQNGHGESDNNHEHNSNGHLHHDQTSIMEEHPRNSDLMHQPESSTDVYRINLVNTDRKTSQEKL